MALGAALLVATVAVAKLPQRNMTVELRTVSQAELDRQTASQAPASSGYVLRTQPSGADGLEIQKVFVANGEQVQMALNRQTPYQWVKAAGVQTTPRSGTTVGVENALQWTESARSLTVRVRWPGGKQAAALDIQVDTADEDARVSQNVPGQLRSRVATSVSVPLGQWATLAVSGTRAAVEKTGVYSTRTLDSDAVQLLQVRVLAP